MTEIIPAIDIIDAHCVRLSQGDYGQCRRYDASPVDMVRRFVDYGLTRVHVVDLDGAKASSPKNLRVLEHMAAVPSASIEWGGGIKSDVALRDIFNAGASYAVVGSVAVKEPHLFEKWLQSYGTDRMILGADVRGRNVAISGWLEQSQLNIDQLIEQFLPHGLSQVICTDISCDGMLSGPNYELYNGLVQQFPKVTFTVSGGIGSLEHIERLMADGLPRIIVGKAIYEGLITLGQLSKLV